MGLCDQFHQVRSHIISLDALPKLNKVYSMVTHEESNVLLTSNPQAQPPHVFYSAKASTSKASTVIQSAPTSHAEKSFATPQRLSLLLLRRGPFSLQSQCIIKVADQLTPYTTFTTALFLAILMTDDISFMHTLRTINHTRVHTSQRLFLCPRIMLLLMSYLKIKLLQIV